VRSEPFLLLCTLLYAVRQLLSSAPFFSTGISRRRRHESPAAGDPLFTHVTVPTYLGQLHLAGIYLRDRRTRPVPCEINMGSYRNLIEVG